MGQILKILTWRDFGPLRQWCRKFSSGILYPFWPPYRRKLRFGLTTLQLNGAFDWRATKTWVRSFSPSWDYFSVLSTNFATNGGGGASRFLLNFFKFYLQFSQNFNKISQELLRADSKNLENFLKNLCTQVIYCWKLLVKAVSFNLILIPFFLKTVFKCVVKTYSKVYFYDFIFSFSYFLKN